MLANGQVRHRFPENENTREQDGDEDGRNKEVVMRGVIRDKLVELKEDVLRDMARQLDPDFLLERLWTKAQKESDTWLMDNGTKLNTDRTKDARGARTVMSSKVFIARDSQLTDLLKIKHIATIYNVFIATLITLFLSTIIHDVINTGTVNLGFHLLSWNFSGFFISILIWIEMMGLAIGMYYGYRMWAKARASSRQHNKSLLDKTALVLFVLLFAAHLAIPCIQVRTSNLPFASSSAVLMEQVRLLMKTYAFVRTNVPRTLAHKATSTEPYFTPSINKYLYFLFAPTIIYSDEYPRTSYIRWDYAGARFAEVLCIILYVAFIGERYILPTVRDFGKPEVPFHRIIAMIIDNALPAITSMVCIFYAILHAWMNGMAEILRFADRMFYRDWWNTTGYAEYYKTWNIVVYDWLYTFIYKDAGVIFFSSRWAKAILVIAVSAVFHEYVMAASLGFFLPVFIVVYGMFGPFVMQLTSTNRTIGNVWIWFTLCLGSGIMITLYLAEYYARVNCPKTIDSDVWDFFIPRMITCYSQ